MIFEKFHYFSSVPHLKTPGEGNTRNQLFSIQTIKNIINFKRLSNIQPCKERKLLNIKKSGTSPLILFQVEQVRLNNKGKYFAVKQEEIAIFESLPINMPHTLTQWPENAQRFKQITNQIENTYMLMRQRGRDAVIWWTIKA